MTQESQRSAGPKMSVRASVLLKTKKSTVSVSCGRSRYANPPRNACSGIAKKWVMQLRTIVVASRKGKEWYEFAYRRRNRYVLTMSVSKRKVRELFQYQTSYLRVSVSSFSYTHCYNHRVSCECHDKHQAQVRAADLCLNPLPIPHTWQMKHLSGDLEVRKSCLGCITYQNHGICHHCAILWCRST